MRMAVSRREHIEAIVAALPWLPGVYRMLAEDASVLYVGKAKQLRQRVSSYFQKTAGSAKTRALVERIADIEVTVTETETEALLLEQTLIKALSPPYNILLRDDKSYPGIYLSQDEPYPRLALHRGVRRARGLYYGPYPSAHAVRESLQILQKLFRVRQCEDAFFRHRQRPCLQAQIGRCRAPCVGAVSEQDYAEDVRMTRLFLEGRSDAVIQHLMQSMTEAAERLDFEQAAQKRDQIQALRLLHEQQVVHRHSGSVDVVVAVMQAGLVCVAVLAVRGGRVLGSRHYFPHLQDEVTVPQVLADFLPQYYLRAESFADLPEEVVLDSAYEDAAVLAEAVVQAGGRRLEFKDKVREDRAAWRDLARLNAEEALKARLHNRLRQRDRLRELGERLGLSNLARIECFDISHTQGEATTASCVVFDGQGADKKSYRHFNIEGVTAGDDFAAMHQALQRRFSGSLATTPRPQLLLIDGGPGQLAQAAQVLQQLGIADILLVGVAKGEGRKPGLETLHFVGGRQVHLAVDDRAFLLIQQVRDEAHRFAISGHRARRQKKRQHSVLEHIPGVGPRRRQQLLAYWGGLQDLQRATVRELSMTPGISVKLAEQIHAALRGNPQGD